MYINKNKIMNEISNLITQLGLQTSCGCGNSIKKFLISKDPICKLKKKDIRQVILVVIFKKLISYVQFIFQVNFSNHFEKTQKKIHSIIY